MKIDETINACGFCSIKQRTFRFENGTLLPYFCCKRSLYAKDCNHNCDNCKKIFSRYIIIDLLDDSVKNICEESVFLSNDEFERFQRQYLSSIFFYESDFVRYNIYLIFICDNPNNEKFKPFLSNMDYARKLFFTLGEFKDYFCFFEDISRLCSQKNNAAEDYSLLSINRIEKELFSKGMISLLTDSIEPFSLYRYIMYDSLTLDEITELEKIVDTNNDNELNSLNTNKKYELKFIKRMVLDHFRTNCFAENTEINFGKCNVIFGKNTAGKTSLLDAIEYGCTSKVKDLKVEDSKVNILWNNDEFISSFDVLKSEKEIKDTWYPYELGTLDENFRQVNYFDIDAAYRFALEQKNTEKANSYINQLFCNRKLIQIQEALINNKRSLEQLLNIFEDRISIRKKEKTTVTPWKVIRNTIRIIKRVFGISSYSYVVNRYYTDAKRSKNKLYEIISITNEKLDQINLIINKQMASNSELVNVFFSRLFSYNYYVSCEKGRYYLKDLNSNIDYNVDKMSTAQRVCLALSVIFAKFFSTSNSPRIILLDESVANLDSGHLLNLLDLLRDLSEKDIQIFFTTANEEVFKIAKSKFAFLEEDFYSHNLIKNSNNKTEVLSQRGLQK